MSNRQRFPLLVGIVAILAVPSLALAQFPQGFDSSGAAVGPLPAGWVSVNNSPGGPGTNPNWQQRGDQAVFPQHGGTGYAFANFNSSTLANTISNYMMSPEVTLENGTIIRFWTRCPTGTAWPDRLILTYSINGASTAPADFANLANPNLRVLVSVNPNLVLGAGGYPEVWTQFVSPPISGLAGPTQGRIAFWYYVTNGGPNGANSNYIGVDDVELIPPGATTGACCDGVGNCTSTTPAACTGPGNTYFGIASDCAAVSCVGKCCQPSGFCANLGPADCTGAGFVFSGLGTACNPQTPDECLGRCCNPDGSCIADGQEPCLAGGGTFGGIGVACGDGSICRGRCCVGANTCIPDSSPNSCATAGGTLTLGANCQSTTDFNFNVSVPIPDGPAGGGFGTPVSNVQNVSGVSGNITDLNVDIKITHTWVGDLVVDITHGATTVTVIDLMGQLTPLGGGCGSNNLDVILDDEGTGGAIEDQCQAANAAATSPPNYTPNNPLSAFDGMNPNGPWTITCRDTFQADVGTITGWSLHFANATSPCAPSCACKGDMNGSGAVNGADINKFAQCVAAGPAIGAGCACADMNASNSLNSADVTPFVNHLISGVTPCVP